MRTATSARNVTDIATNSIAMTDAQDTEQPQGVALTADEVLTLMAESELDLEGLMPHGSNYTFLAYAQTEQHKLPVIYKPIRGEQPLWDFPTGTLALREVCAYQLSEALGWNFVPPTILRDGPHGPGSVQFYVHCDPEVHYFTLEDSEKESLRPAALFDFIANNADRKGGHVLKAEDNRLWLIDHGLCFHHEYKLRSVIWEFAEQPIEPERLAAISEFRTKLEDTALREIFEDLLNTVEMNAMKARIDDLLSTKQYPAPGPGRHYPWPPV